MSPQKKIQISGRKGSSTKNTTSMGNQLSTCICYYRNISRSTKRRTICRNIPNSRARCFVGSITKSLYRHIRSINRDCPICRTGRDVCLLKSSISLRTLGCCCIIGSEPVSV